MSNFYAGRYQTSSYRNELASNDIDVTLRSENYLIESKSIFKSSSIIYLDHKSVEEVKRVVRLFYLEASQYLLQLTFISGEILAILGIEHS